MRLKPIQPSNKIGFSTLDIRHATAWRSKIILVAFLFASVVQAVMVLYHDFYNHFFTSAAHSAVNFFTVHFALRLCYGVATGTNLRVLFQGSKILYIFSVKVMLQNLEGISRPC